ncbi:MAG TPA: glycosyltransferase family 2 protein [Solirubrobacteraceae bacterium]|nr:glycosyltransferase family 2 protein [Solirubrobacteraceae bacterium]
MARPRVDVVVPFRGELAALEELRARLMGLKLEPGDTLVVVDNTPGRGPGSPAGPAEVPVLRAAQRATPGFARNRGAAWGSAEWLVFIDADTEPTDDLLDRYFDPPPDPGTGLIAGGVVDEVVPPNGPAPARYAYLRGTLNQDRTLSLGRWAFVQTANAACRRVAFEAIGGFREDIWPAEDADLTYRLKAAGWEVERREGAAVVHHSRATVRAFIEQGARHGAGCAWLDRTYPGSFPPRRRPGLVWWAVRATTKGLFRAVRRRDRDEAVRGLFGSLWELSLEFGRSGSIDRRGSA